MPSMNFNTTDSQDECTSIMGNYASKLFGHLGEQTSEFKYKPPNLNESQLCTPPTMKKPVSADPRSATVGIPRTPIEITHTPPALPQPVLSAVPKYLRSKPYLETDFDVMPAMTMAPKKIFDPRSPNVDKPRTPILIPGSIELDIQNSGPLTSNNGTPEISSVEKLRYEVLGIDPRSPALDFDRTPILPPKSLQRLKARSQENLTRRGSYLDPDAVCSSRMSYCETTTVDNVPEIQALPEMKASTLSKFTELLDEHDSSSSSIETVLENPIDVTSICNTDNETPKNAKPDSSNLSSSIENICGLDETSTEPKVTQYDPTFSAAASTVEEVLSVAVKKAEKQENLMDAQRKIKIWRDSLSPDIPLIPDINALENLALMNETKNTLPKEEIIIEFDDNEVMKGFNCAARKSEKSNETKMKKQEMSGKKSRIIKADGRIVKDNRKNVTPDAKNISQSQKARTPLGNRSNNHGKVLSIVSKSPQQLLRNKAMTTKNHQENTPPRNMSSKLNGTQWDHDSTVII